MSNFCVVRKKNFLEQRFLLQEIKRDVEATFAVE